MPNPKPSQEKTSSLRLKHNWNQYQMWELWQLAKSTRKREIFTPKRLIEHQVMGRALAALVRHPNRYYCW
jgi:hypothetical protein